MSDILKTIITDFHKANVKLTKISTKRDVEIQHIQGKATICIGVRRCGKSTLMLQIIQKLLADKVPKQNIVYINFFDDRLHFIHAANIGLIVDVYYEIYPQKRQEKVYYFFDEIQMCKGWEMFVERIMRTENCEVYITGSSAKMLSKEIATQMRGRSLSWEIFPFSFSEFLKHRKISYDMPISSSEQAFIRNEFQNYWNLGGFPETADLNPQMRVQMHQEYFSALLFRDLIERYDIPHPKAVADLAYWFMDNVSSMYTVNRLTEYLKSLGHKITKNSVLQYIEWFEDAYFLFTVRIFNASLAKSNTNPKKIYCIDHAFVTSIASGILLNSGHLLENLVFVWLRRQYDNIYYYKTKTGKEVDFVVRDRSRAIKLIQVTESLAAEKTRNREVNALREAMRENAIATGIIVTRDEQETIKTEEGTIEVIPAWRFLL